MPGPRPLTRTPDAWARGSPQHPPNPIPRPRITDPPNTEPPNATGPRVAETTPRVPLTGAVCPHGAGEGEGGGGYVSLACDQTEGVPKELCP